MDQNLSPWGFDFAINEKELASIANDITKFWKWIYICINKVHFLFRLKLEMSFNFTHWILFIYDCIAWKSFLLLSISFIDRKHYFFMKASFIKHWNIWYNIRWIGIYFMLKEFCRSNEMEFYECMYNDFTGALPVIQLLNNAINFFVLMEDLKIQRISILIWFAWKSMIMFGNSKCRLL